MIDVRRRTLPLLTLLGALALAACSNPATNPDTGTPGGDSSTDPDATAGMDVVQGTDAPTDGRRQRDTAVMMADSALSRCFIEVTPRTGTASSTFVVTGTGFSGNSVILQISQDGTSGAPLVNEMVTTTPQGDGASMFTYNFMRAGLAPGEYTATARDPLFVCMFGAPFTVN